MNEDKLLAEAARMFRVLGNESRLLLLSLVSHENRPVSALAEAAKMSQPLTSQHLRILRDAGLLEADRRGKEVIYRIADHHVEHVVRDAIAHARENA